MAKTPTLTMVMTMVMTMNKIGLPGIHNRQTKSELVHRIEMLAIRLDCHPDLIYARVVDMQKEIATLPIEQRLKAEETT